MRVLVAPEFSGRVRDAFRERGHDAWSLDVFPSERSNEHHIQYRLARGDQKTADILNDSWDMAIFHPPCTYLALCNSKRFYRLKAEQEAAVDFARMLWDWPTIPRKALENPKSVLSTRMAPKSQTIHPWMFGHMEQKETWLWLHNLPPLVATNNVESAMLELPYDRRGRVHHMAPSIRRRQDRSRTYQGIADAMAEQWGKLA